MSTHQKTSLIWLTLIPAMLAFSLHNPHPSPIEIKSSLSKNELQMVISLTSQLSSQVQLTTESLQSKHGNHTLSLGQDKINIEPRLQDEVVVFNYRHDNQYLIALSHSFDGHAHFLPLKIGYEGKWGHFLLPALNMQMNDIQVDSLYGCHRALVSVVRREDKSIEVKQFTTEKKSILWIMDKKQSEWRNAFEDLFFATTTVTEDKLPLKIFLSSGKYCVLDLNSLPSHTQLPSRKHFSVNDLLEWAPVLQLHDQVLNEEL